MDDHWTLAELTKEAANRIAAMPPPKNGQVRAVPDDRTIRYYGTIGLLDKPALRGRIALYGPRHLAQVISIKRLQSAGRSLAEIQAMWPELDDVALSRMSGVVLAGAKASRASRSEFWKTAPENKVPPPAVAREPRPLGGKAPTWLQPAFDVEPEAIIRQSEADTAGRAAVPVEAGVELRILLAPGITLSIAVEDGIALNPDDVRAIRAAASPLVELASRRLGLNDGGDDR